MNDWSPTWPTLPGWYWVYGDPHGGCDFRLAAVRVRLMGNGSPAYVCEGHFVYRETAGKCLWKALPAPELPGVL